LKLLDEKVFNDKSKWICPAIRCFPSGWTTTYIINTESDCPKKSALIKIAASGYFILFDEAGNKIGSGYSYPKQY
jgi:hypothetical protein